ncbi:hypothetical protein DFH08DRAFT_1030860 [Mycena albidolilacea]|uniref:Uncharacterized protein n=1 Tax=Mycena albidolilacea TaxID=1033008 RepID=A0AAD7AKL0_9AGAR|nr:hypothetical protein DFH08DRAFT_1030860 [Mycena albidolilacea]
MYKIYIQMSISKCNCKGNNWQWLTTSDWVERGSLVYYLQHERKEVPHLTQHVTQSAGSAGSWELELEDGNWKRKPETKQQDREGKVRGRERGARVDVLCKGHSIWCELYTAVGHVQGTGTCRFREYGPGVQGEQGSNVVTMAGQEEGGGRTMKGTDPMRQGPEAHQESPDMQEEQRPRGTDKDETEDHPTSQMPGKARGKDPEPRFGRGSVEERAVYPKGRNAGSARKTSGS